MADSLELDWLVTPMNSHSFYRAILAAAVTLAPALAVPMLSGCNSHPDAEAAAVAPLKPAAPQPTLTPQPAPAPLPAPVPASAIPDPKTFTTTGPLVAEQQADIAAERTGRILSIAVQIGDHVKRGQILAQLDDRGLRSTCDAQKARIASAQADVLDWEAEEESVKADLRRADLMLKEKIISDEAWEHVKYKLDETKARVAHYHSEEAAAEAELNTANLQLEQSRIVAPFAGVVGRSSVRPEQEVKPGDVLFWVTAEAPLRVLFTVPESLMSSFATGKGLVFTTADYAGLQQAGRIIRVSPVIDPASGSVQVIGDVIHPSPLLKPGMTMQVRLAP
jgi:RND family efflux transporter MFP subunit